MHFESPERYLRPCGTQVKVILAPMVRALTLRVSLLVLFEMREGVTTENKHLVDLGTIIHRTWMDMKSGSAQVMEFKDNSILKDRLSAVFAKHNVKIDIQNPHTNPLDLILPGFETFWRIVLRLFIVLHNCKDYKQVLLEFVQKPTPTQFKLELGREHISSELLSKKHSVSTHQRDESGAHGCSRAPNLTKSSLQMWKLVS